MQPYNTGLLSSRKMPPNIVKGRVVKFWQMNPNTVGKNPEGVIL
jgi:hypothetical protein